MPHTSPGVPSPGAAEETPPSSTHPFKDLNKAQRLQEHTEIHPQAHNHKKGQGRQQEPRPAPASCCSTPCTSLYGQPLPHPSPGDGVVPPTGAQLRLFRPPLGAGETMQWLSQGGTALAILCNEAEVISSSPPSSAPSSSLPTQHTLDSHMCCAWSWMV